MTANGYEVEIVHEDGTWTWNLRLDGEIEAQSPRVFAHPATDMVAPPST